MSRFSNIFGGRKSMQTLPNGDTFYPAEFNVREVKELSRTDYLRLYTGWAYSATSTIAQTVASLEKHLLRDKKTGQPIEHEYMNLITYELLLKVASYMQLNGSCYIWKFKIGNKVQSLEILRPDLVMFDENADGSLKGYRYQVNNKNMILNKDEVMAFHNFNPQQAFPYSVKGVSPMQAVAVQMEMDTVANRWNWKFFSNGASVRDIFKTDQKLSDETKKRFVSRWRNEFQGVNNAHKVAILDSGLEYANASPSQREMDFVESRRFTRDEVFGIFKVPKIIAGMSEDFNRATAIVANDIYMKHCIYPLTVQIQEAFNRQLFDGIGYFEFVNVVPVDEEALERDFNNGAITLNEYREMKGWKRVKDGDTLKMGFGEPMAIVYEKQSVSKTASNTIALVEKITTKTFKDDNRDNYGQKVWEAKIARTNKFEAYYASNLKNIWAEQEKDMTLSLHKGAKSYKESWNSTKYVAMWMSLFLGTQKDLIISEANEALNLVGIETFFRPGTDVLDKYMRANIKKMAKEVDEVTKQKVFDLIDKGNNDGLSVQDISKSISGEFAEFGRKRANVIARTEVTRASNWASETAWKESGVVNKKEWFTSTDERVCEYCGPMNGKTVQLGENFFDKGDNYNGLTLSYESIKGAPLHPNCRCTLLPVVE